MRNRRIEEEKKTTRKYGRDRFLPLHIASTLYFLRARFQVAFRSSNVCSSTNKILRWIHVRSDLGECESFKMHDLRSPIYLTSIRLNDNTHKKCVRSSHVMSSVFVVIFSASFHSPYSSREWKYWKYKKNNLIHSFYQLFNFGTHAKCQHHSNSIQHGMRRILYAQKASISIAQNVQIEIAIKSTWFNRRAHETHDTI